MMDPVNHHLHKPVLIGEIRKNGQFKIVYETDGLVAPDPWDDITSADKDCDSCQAHGNLYSQTVVSRAGQFDCSALKRRKK